MNLPTLANISQIVSVVWVLIFGSLSLPGVIEQVQKKLQSNTFQNKLILLFFRGSTALALLTLALSLVILHVPLTTEKGGQSISTQTPPTVPTATPVPTGTVPPTSSQVLGNQPPIISDSLSSQDNLQWDVYPLDQNGACTFQGGAYHAISTPGNSNSCLATQAKFRDIAALQADLKIIRGDIGGIIFHSNAKEDSFYAFTITTNGSYSLIKSFFSNNGQTYAPLASGTSQQIKQGVNQLNTLTVIIHGSTFSLYINTQYIGAASDASYTSGLVGVFTNTDGGSTAEAAFTHFQVWGK